jgi:hypothetical protein
MSPWTDAVGEVHADDLGVGEAGEARRVETRARAGVEDPLHALQVGGELGLVREAEALVEPPVLHS